MSCKTEFVRIRPFLLALIVTALSLTGCTGSNDKGADPDKLAARLATAKRVIDGAETITLSLATPKLPTGVTGLLSAKGQGKQGKGADPAAFKGKVTVVTGGSSLDAEVIAIGDKVWAKTSFAPVYLTIDPKTLKAPNPADLLGPQGEGLPVILVKTDKLTGGQQSRDGKDVLTSISGTISGRVISEFLPSAEESSTFKVIYRLTDDDVLRDARITGAFYPKGGDVTYLVKLDASDSPVSIEAPTRPSR